MPPRERDLRTGRYISSRENTRELEGSEALPGAIKIDVPGAHEPAEIAEADRTTERIRAEEPTSRMSEESDIPTYMAVTPRKIATFSIEKLDRTNASSWKAQYKIFLETQGCWEVVKYTYNWRGNATRVTKLLEDLGWRTSDATAKLYILQNLKQEDKASVQSLRSSGDMWAYLLEKYERRTQVDVTNAIRKVTRWQMDPKMSLEEAMQQLEKYHAELEDTSRGEVKFTSKVLMIFFLDGLPPDYDSMKYSLLAQENLARGVILSRLQQQESMMKTAKEEESPQEFANRAKQRRCFNCDRIGHFARDCTIPKKDREQNEKKNRESKRNKKNGKGKDQRAYGKRQKGKARTADERSAYDSDLSDGSRSSTSEDARQVYEYVYRVQLKEQISDRFEHVLEENEEKAYQIKGSDDPIIDSGATSTCSGKIDLFESLDQRYGGSLGTAGKTMKIAGRGTMRIPLSSGKTARIANALYVPKMRQTLLSTQALQDMGIWNEHVRKKYRFFKERGEILAKGYNIGRTSYLGWVGRKNALATGYKKPEREYARLVKQIDWELLHRRLGHPGEGRFMRMVKKMGLKPTDKDIKDLKTCETCIQARSVKRQNHGNIPRASRPLKRVYMDFWGPYNKAKTPERYYLSLTDDCTRFSWVYLTEDREAATVKKILEKWLALVEREKGVKLLVIRTDNAREFKALKPWASGKGIRIEFTEPDTPQQNGVAERLNRHLLEITRAILIDADVPKEYWPYAIKMANYLRNRAVRVRGTKKTPFEIWMGYPPDMSKFRIPFSRVWFHRKTNDKLEPRAIEGVFVGYESSRNHYLVMAKKDRKIHRITNPIFLENKRGFISKEPGVRDILDEPMFQRILGVPKTSSETGEGIIGVPEGTDLDGATTNDAGMEYGSTRTEDAANRDVDEVVNKARAEAGSHQSFNSTNQRLENEPQPSLLRPTSQPPTLPTTPEPSDAHRPSRIRKPTLAAIESKQTETIYGRKPQAQRRREEREAVKDPSPRPQAVEQQQIQEVANLAVALEHYLSDHNAFQAKAKTEEFSGQIPIPKTYREAINDPTYGTKWKEAIKLELNTLIQFGTWRYVRRPEDQAVVSTKWVFNIKYTADGRIDRFKARLVARGFSQREGLDYEDTFAPVIRLESLRILFALAATYNLKAHLLDATNAYVGSKLDKQIFMEIPEGVDPKSYDPNDVCEILQSLYGLRQSGHLWNEKVKKFVISIGFRQSTADPGVFINERGIIIALYVDDILVFGKDIKDIESTKDQLKSFHPMKDSGPAQKILGIRITQTKDSIQLDQETYAQSILEEFDMLNSNPQDIPLSPSIDLNDESSKKLPRDLHDKFRQIIGRLTYLAGGTRPDIQFPVNRLSQHLADARDVHLRASKQLLRYIKGTISYGITYRAKGSEGSLIGYSDSSYANATKYRSTSAYVFMMAGGPVSWCSRKQPITAMSTTEAEYIAAAEAAKQAIWIRHFLAAIQKHPKRPTQLGLDNQGALALAANPVNHLRSKHIRVRYHAIRDFIEHGDIKPFYIPTAEMVADGLTKATKKEGLKQMIRLLQLG